VKILIRAGADPNLPPRNPAHRGLTPLILAIVNGTDEISQFIINSLCNLNQHVEDGKNSICYLNNSPPSSSSSHLFQVIQLYITVF
jgi:ankyrin repeat protein